MPHKFIHNLCAVRAIGCLPARVPRLFQLPGNPAPLVRSGNVVGKVNGYNAWPKDFEAFRAILDAFGGAQGGSCVVFPKATKEKVDSPQ